MHKLIAVGGLGLLGMLSTAAQALPCAGFTDVEDTSPFCGNVTWLKNRGVTLGCAPGLYCPAEFVSRLQMAAFMNRLGDSLFPLTCAAGQVMKWDGLQWACANDAIGGGGGGGTVTSVAAGTGLQGSPNPITGAGAINIAPAYQLPQACSNGQVPKSNGAGGWACGTDTAGAGTVTSVATGAGLTGGPVTTTGTIAADTAYLQRRVSATCAAGSSIRTINADGTVACETDDGTVTSVATGPGLTGGTITATGTVGLAATQLLPTTACAVNQVPQWNGSAWTCAVAGGTGTVTSVATGTGLTGGPVTTAGTIAVNTATIQARVTGSCPVGSYIRTIAADGTVTCQADGTGPANAFVQGGNAFGAVATLGTNDNFAVDLRANGSRVMRYEPNAISPNVVGGRSTNSIATGVSGGTIAGGGWLNAGLGMENRNEVLSDLGTVGGGSGNVAGAIGATASENSHATVAGGSYNIASGPASVVAGGSNNIASGPASVVAGGAGNRAMETMSFVGGGESNRAVFKAVVAGGRLNQAIGGISVVAGGAMNVASGIGSTVPGGAYNEANGDYSFAAGYRAKANAPGVFALADSTDLDFVGLTPNTFVARFTGGYGFWTTTTFSNGCTLSPGGGAWSCTSSRDEKKEFAAIDPRTVLERVVALPVSEWRYRAEATGARHMGPMAQDFHAAFALGDSDRSIGLLDASGVALAAIQGLNLKVEEQRAALREREAEIRALREEVAALRDTRDDVASR